MRGRPPCVFKSFANQRSFSPPTAADGKAPIATVEEEDDDVPGENDQVFP